MLENDYEIVDGICFVGATFWTNFDNNNPTSKLIVEDMLNDYRYTYLERYEDMDYLARHSNKPRRITADFIYEKHIESLNYIMQLVDIIKNPIVVITHHPPTLNALNRKHSGNGLDAGFASNYDDLIKSKPNIKAWISGHTHMSHDFMIGETRMISNQCGYFSEKCFPGFKADKVREVEV